MRSDLHDYRTHVERLVQIQIYERLAVDVDPVFRGMGYDGLRDAVDDGELNPVLREAATAALRRIAGAADYSDYTAAWVIGFSELIILYASGLP